MFFVSAYTFSYLTSKKKFARSTLITSLAHADYTCATHSMCITDSTSDTKCRIVSLLFPPAKLRSNERNESISITTFILTPQRKSKSTHSNLFKKKKAEANKQEEQIQSKNYITLNQFRPFFGL